MRIIKKTKKALVYALVSSLLLLSGCGDEGGEVSETSSNNSSSSSSNKKETENFVPKIGERGGKRVITSISPPKTFNNYLAAETSSTDVMGQMYIGLLTTDPITTDIVPNLAESWEISDDKMTYLVKLRKDLKWSDGEPLTSDDVVFTYNEIINNKLIPNNTRDGVLVEGKFPLVEKVDDLTIKFVTPVPFVPFLRSSLAAEIMPKHILGGLVKPDSTGKLKFNQWGGLGSDPKSIVCNGPFKLKTYVAGQRVILERNTHYWKKDAEGNQLPYVDEFVTEMVKDEEVQVIKFKAQETDSLVVEGKNFEFLKKEEEKLNFKIKQLGPETGTVFVMLNQSTAKNSEKEQVVDPIKSKWFKNVNFRRALAHSIDKQSMIQGVYRGLAKPQITHISQQSPFYNPNVPVYEFDLDKAAKILEGEGFKKNDSGELYDKDGNRVEFNLVTNSGNVRREAMCSMIRNDWGKLGIKVNYKPEQFNTMVRRIDESLDWEAMMIGLTGNAIEPHGGINGWRLAGRMHMFNMGNAEQNAEWTGRATSYSDWEHEMIKLYTEGAKEFDLTKRKAIYAKAQEVEASNIPYLFTVNQISLIATRNNIGNAHPSLHGGSKLNQVNWNAEEHFIISQ